MNHGRNIDGKRFDNDRKQTALSGDIYSLARLNDYTPDQDEPFSVDDLCIIHDYMKAGKTLQWIAEEFDIPPTEAGIETMRRRATMAGYCICPVIVRPGREPSNQNCERANRALTMKECELLQAEFISTQSIGKGVEQFRKRATYWRTVGQIQAGLLRAGFTCRWGLLAIKSKGQWKKPETILL